MCSLYVYYIFISVGHHTTLYSQMLYFQPMYCTLWLTLISSLPNSSGDEPCVWLSSRFVKKLSVVVLGRLAPSTYRLMVTSTCGQREFYDNIAFWTFMNIYSKVLAGVYCTYWRKLSVWYGGECSLSQNWLGRLWCTEVTGMQTTTVLGTRGAALTLSQH